MKIILSEKYGRLASWMRKLPAQGVCGEVLRDDRNTLWCERVAGEEFVVKRFAVLQARLELRCFGLQLRIAHRLVFFRHRFDLIDDGVDAFELTVTVRAEHFAEKTHITKLPFVGA